MNRLPAYSYGSEGYIAKDGSVYSFVKDYQGNVCQVVNERGGVAQESDYYPYGMLFGESDVSGDRSEANRYRYGGKEYLAAAGLNLYDQSARYYDPSTLQFGSADPITDNSRQMSQFAFCNANPVMFTDPTGESAEIEYLDNGTTVVTSKLYFYGTYASSDLSRKIADGIACNWNSVKATITTSDGKKYDLVFKIYYETVSIEKAEELAANNTSARNNFIRIENGTESSGACGDKTDPIKGCNTFWFNINDDLENSLTPSHEYGHGLGLEHPAGDFSSYEGRPDIMIPRNTEYGKYWSVKTTEGKRVVNPNSRRVTVDNVRNASHYNWGKQIINLPSFNLLPPKDGKFKK